jgi:hypothetical protein
VDNALGGGVKMPWPIGKTHLRQFLSFVGKTHLDSWTHWLAGKAHRRESKVPLRTN